MFYFYVKHILQIDFSACEYTLRRESVSLRPSFKKDNYSFFPKTRNICYLLYRHVRVSTVVTLHCSTSVSTFRNVYIIFSGAFYLSITGEMCVSLQESTKHVQKLQFIFQTQKKIKRSLESQV